VSDASDGDPSDVSDGVFSIVSSVPGIAVAPSSLSFTAQEGGSNPANQSITITNSGGGSLNWTASENPERAWLNLSNTTGSDGDAVSVSVNISGLTAGTYSSAVRISDASASNSPVDVPVTLTVTPESSGDVLAELQAEASPSLPNDGWEVTINEGRDALLALANSINNPPENYRLDYQFNVPAGISGVYVFAEIDVNGDGGDDSFWVGMNGSDDCKWNNMYNAGDGWIRKWVYDQGSDSKHLFSVSPGANVLNLYPREAGAYINWLVVSTNPDVNIDDYAFNGGGNPDTPELAIDPASLQFNAAEGGMSPAAQNIVVSNSGGDSLNWTATENPEQGWLTLQNTSGSDNDILIVSVDAAGLSAGSYSASVRISDPAASNDPVDATISLTVTASQPDSIRYHVNAGGDAFVAEDGTYFEADQAYLNGGWGYTAGSVYAVSDSIAGTNDDALYQSERYGNYSYRFTLPDGEYDAVFHFAEIYFNNPGSRLFSVEMEDIPISALTSYDIYADAGHDAAIRKSYNVSVSDGLLDVDFISIVDAAKISAIEVVPASPASPQLALSTGSLMFGSVSEEQSFILGNTGQGTLSWEVSESPEEAWIVISEPHSGYLNPGEQTQVTVNVLPGGMDPGGYSGTLLVTSNGGSAEVNVSMVIDEIQQQEAEFTFYMHDHLGNTRAALYEDGAVKEYYDYYPFGMVSRNLIAGADSTRYTFTGKELVFPSHRSGTMWR
jgi:hypothetical protein